MQFSFRLAQVLDELGERRRGTIGRLANGTGIERHQLSKMLRNQVRSISLDALASLCNYLEREFHVDPQKLPGILFGREREGVWAFLTEENLVHICYGVRFGAKRHGEARHDHSWVQASDMFLNTSVINGLHGAQATSNEALPTRPRIVQHLVPTYPRTFRSALDRRQARIGPQGAKRIYDEYCRNRANTAFVSIGSIKSNPATELPIAATFRATAFEEALPGLPQDRDVPFFFAYRENDTQPPSCHGGLGLVSGSHHPPTPGIHYEADGGKWDFASCDDRNDAALVFYVYHRNLASLELTLGGFSGRSTEALRDVIRNRVADLWPASLETDEAYYGAFIVPMEFPCGRKDTVEDANLRPTSLDVIRLPAEVFERRILARSRGKPTPGA